MLLLLWGITAGIFSVNMDYTIHPEIESLNKAIPLSHRFTRESWGWSWSTGFVEKNVIFGLHNIKGSQQQEKEKVSMDLSFNARMFEVGYFFDFPIIMVYLEGGGGYSHVNLNVAKVPDSSTFSGILKEPGGIADLTGSCLSISFSGGFIIPLTEYLGVNLIAGYVFGLKKPDWKFESGDEVYNDPNMNLHQIYIKAGFVLGSFKH